MDKIEGLSSPGANGASAPPPTPAVAQFGASSGFGGLGAGGAGGGGSAAGSSSFGTGVTFQFGTAPPAPPAPHGLTASASFQPAGGGGGGTAGDPASSRVVRKETSAGGKRSKGEVDLDDVLGQITSKMHSLSTAAGSADWSATELISIFMEVLDVDTEQAQFFLESANYQIELAVSLCFDTLQQYSRHSQFRPSSSQQHHQSTKTQGFVGREVEIVGLPPGWKARVSRHTGHVYFVNTNTGETQQQVPPGFADLPPASSEAGAGAGAEAWGEEGMGAEAEAEAEAGAGAGGEMDTTAGGQLDDGSASAL